VHGHHDGIWSNTWWASRWARWEQIWAVYGPNQRMGQKRSFLISTCSTISIKALRSLEQPISGKIVAKTAVSTPWRQSRKLAFRWSELCQTEPNFLYALHHHVFSNFYKGTNSSYLTKTRERGMSI
jgi:hypothetical protein